MEEFYAKEALEDCETLSFKFNCPQGYDDEQLIEVIDHLQMYVSDYSNRFYATAGKHTEGKNQVPHIHLNVIVLDYNHKSNESRRRKDWAKAMGYCPFPRGISMSQGVIEDFGSAQKVLAYPLKEGKVMASHRIPKNLLGLLQSYGEQEWEAKKQRDLQKVRQQEKTENLHNQILELIPKSLHFTDYGSYKRYIYTKFYEKLKLNEYPQRRSVETAVQNIAIFLKVVDPWFFDKF